MKRGSDMDEFEVSPWRAPRPPRQRLPRRRISLSEALIGNAKTYALLTKRSTAEVIELWASIGRLTAPSLSHKNLVEIMDGRTRIRLTQIPPTDDYGRRLKPEKDDTAHANPIATVLCAVNDLSKIIELLGLKPLGEAAESDIALHDLLKVGLPKRCLNRLIQQTGFTAVEVASVLDGHEHMVDTWMLAAEQDECLTTLQSSQLFVLGLAFVRAQYVHGSRTIALIWLRESSIGLGGRRPMDLLKTFAGASAVLRFLYQIDTGVYV